MAIHDHSTPMSGRRLLPLGASAPAPLLSRRDELLAILDAGPILPEQIAFLSLQRQREAARSIEALIEALDALDGDPDLEDGADTEPNYGGHNTNSANDECEDCCEDEGADIEAQPQFDDADHDDWECAVEPWLDLVCGPILDLTRSFAVGGARV